eukprot:COSAG01_NODE_2010_length_8657_cov_6.034237_9_plen_78_part_00
MGPYGEWSPDQAAQHPPCPLLYVLYLHLRVVSKYGNSINLRNVGKSQSKHESGRHTYDAEVVRVEHRGIIFARGSVG